VSELSTEELIMLMNEQLDKQDIFSPKQTINSPLETLLRRKSLRDSIMDHMQDVLEERCTVKNKMKMVPS
jgi:hypothetical protein